jgi:twinkle protein
MEMEQVMELFHTSEALDGDGRVFLSERGLSIPESQKAGLASRSGWIHFGYQRDGKVVRYKSRNLKEKRFLASAAPENFVYPFFNQVDFKKKDYVIITEGEFDCLALITLGIENVISLPNGCNSAESTIKQNYQYLAEFQEIYICFDQDEPGRKSAAEVQQFLPPSKYRNVKLPCKDPNEWLLQENPSKEDFLQLMRKSERIHIPQIVNFKDLIMKPFEAVELGATTSWPELDKLLGGIRQGEITVVTADTGVGKTTFCVNLLYMLANQGYGCWMNAYEMRIDSIYRKLASMILGKKMKVNPFSEIDIARVDEWRNDKKVFVNPVTELVSVTSFKKHFEIAKYAYGVNYVFLDHLDYIHFQDRNSGNVDDIKQVMVHLHSYASEFNIGVILVAHPRKMGQLQKKLTMDDLKGSSSIKQYADNILILTRMSRLEASDDTTEISVAKNRLLGIEGTCRLRYDVETDRYESRVGAADDVRKWCQETYGEF